MAKLRTITNLVMDILQCSPSARNSDNILYFEVLKILGSRNGINIDNMSIKEFLLHMKDYGLPSIESVGRCRRKIVECHPELSGTSNVEAGRVVQEELFRDYARQVNV